MALHKPKTTPHDYGFKAGDFHLIVNAQTKTITAYNSDGVKLWELPCLPEGQNAKWWIRGGDTPPSVYRLGAFYNDIRTGNLHPGYGWQFYDMIDCDEVGREDGENTNGRSGIGLHGGGSSCPDPQAKYQPLKYTLGCVRMHNKDLADYIQPLYESGGTVFLTVIQDDK